MDHGMYKCIWRGFDDGIYDGNDESTCSILSPAVPYQWICYKYTFLYPLLYIWGGKEGTYESMNYKINFSHFLQRKHNRFVNIYKLYFIYFSFLFIYFYSCKIGTCWTIRTLVNHKINLSCYQVNLLFCIHTVIISLDIYIDISVRKDQGVTRKG